MGSLGPSSSMRPTMRSTAMGTADTLLILSDNRFDAPCAPQFVRGTSLSTWDDALLARLCLGGHPKPAINRHLKTGHYG